MTGWGTGPALPDASEIRGAAKAGRELRAGEGAAPAGRRRRKADTEPSIVEVFRDALNELAALLAPLAGMLRITPAVWLASCRGGPPCRECPVCEWEGEILEGATRVRVRPRGAPKPRRYRWKSIDEALADVWAFRIEPARFGARSTHAGIVARLEAGRLGTASEATAQRSDDPDMRHAEDVAQVEVCLRRVCGPLSALARDLVCSGASIAGVEYEPVHSRESIAHARRALLVDMAARELVPLPRRASVRLQEEVERVRARMGGT